MLYPPAPVVAFDGRNLEDDLKVSAILAGFDAAHTAGELP